MNDEMKIKKAQELRYKKALVKEINYDFMED